MSEVTSIPPETPAGVPVGVPVVGVDLGDLDDRGVLEAVGAARRNADREEAALLAAVVAYVDLHPVTDPEDAAGWPTGGNPPGARPVLAPLAGPGTPLVAEFAVEALGAVLRQPYRATVDLDLLSRGATPIRTPWPATSPPSVAPASRTTL